MSADVNLSKTQISIINQSGAFPGTFLGLLQKNLLSIVNVLTPFGKNVLIPLGLTSVVSLAEAGIQETVFAFVIYGLGTKTLITSNEEIKDILKIVESLETSGILPKGASETIKNETEE